MFVTPSDGNASPWADVFSRTHSFSWLGTEQNAAELLLLDIASWKHTDAVCGINCDALFSNFGILVTNYERHRIIAFCVKGINCICLPKPVYSPIWLLILSNERINCITFSLDFLSICLFIFLFSFFTDSFELFLPFYQEKLAANVKADLESLTVRGLFLSTVYVCSFRERFFCELIRE